MKSLLVAVLPGVIPAAVPGTVLLFIGLVVHGLHRALGFLVRKRRPRQPSDGCAATKA